MQLVDLAEEAVEVDVQQREVSALEQEALQHVVERTAIPQAGERVGVGALLGGQCCVVLRGRVVRRSLRMGAAAGRIQAVQRGRTIRRWMAVEVEAIASASTMANRL